MNSILTKGPLMPTEYTPYIGSLLRRFGYGCLVLALALSLGCTTSSRVANTRLENFDPALGYRLKNLNPGEDNSDGLFVILTFSGGGTRAASFAYGVLETLRDTTIVWEGQERTLLDEVDIISSVSGGSLPAGYYGMFGGRIFDDFADKVLYTDIQGSIVKQFFSPKHWRSLMSPFYTRTDLLAEGFDKQIFEQKTYADLIEKGTRPYIVMNSTDIDLGSRFEFTQDQFDFIYSDLSTFHLGHAAAASACFPGGFPPLTLDNYAHRSDYQTPAWVQETLTSGDPGSVDFRQALDVESYSDPERKYIHLMDGGVADNLGLAPVVTAIRSFSGVGVNRGRAADLQINEFVVITVNSAANAATTWNEKKSPVGLIKTLLFAGTAPMGNYTQAQIEYLKLLLRQLEGEGEADSSFTVPELHFVEVSFNYMNDSDTRRELNSIATSFSLPREQVDLLRTSAGTILREHPDFQKLVAGLHGKEQ